ncbi:MAG: anti-sigma factor antagonist [Lachnospiraceae bacterium]|nr:anti-sigma factor antagonist [Lachnospiraceae bacterium]
MQCGTNYEVDQFCLVVEVPEEVDHHVSCQIKEGIEQKMEKHYIRRMIFDFSRTHFMDSSGIGVLLGRYKEMKGRGGDLILCGVNETIGRVLRMSGILGLMPLCPDRQTAKEYHE